MAEVCDLKTIFPKVLGQRQACELRALQVVKFKGNRMDTVQDGRPCFQEYAILRSFTVHF